MNVYYDMSSLRNMTTEQTQTLLIKAREDGRRSLTEKLTSKNVCKLASICQRLSKCPRFYLYGPEFVSRPKYLHEAVQYLSQRFDVIGPTYFLAYAFGICLYDLGNIRIAVEWIHWHDEMLIKDLQKCLSTSGN
jgi:hypothetical protein